MPKNTYLKYTITAEVFINATTPSEFEWILDKIREHGGVTSIKGVTINESEYLKQLDEGDYL